MNPRKFFSLFLLIAACGIWIYNMFLIFNNGGAVDKTTREIFAEKAHPEEYIYRPDFSDPFFCSLFMSEKQKVLEKRESKPESVKAKIALPACKIGGIVYSPDNPMAIFVSGDKSQLVKKGDMVDSITIVSITPQNIEVSYHGKIFILTQ